ncbi:GGDEF domain-containing protein [Litorivita sp. NS0012-18]|uniref:GGDEF domain-containing protein n=1 Tax=Litorivita sp. NS0012-18 TaxID=3127655 RepID=UPI00333FF835
MKYVDLSATAEDDPRLSAGAITYSYVGVAHRSRVFLTGFAILVGMFVLGGYVMEAQFHKPFHALPGTHPLTAVMVLLLATSLVMHRLLEPISIVRRGILLAVVCLSSLRLIEIQSGSIHHPLSAAMARWLAPYSDMSGIETGANTAMCLGLMALSGLLLSRAPRLALWAAVLAGFISLLGATGYAFRLDVLFGAMSPVTVACLVPLALATMTLYAHRRIFRIVLSDTPVGFVARCQIGFSSFLMVLVAAAQVGDKFASATMQNLFLALVLWLIGAMNVITAGIYDRIDRRRRKVERDLVIAALHDSLTGAANRHGLELYFSGLERELEVGVLLIDLDHFKLVNDRYGHKAGDRILATVSTALRGRLRERDVLARWGGEEFLVVLYNVDIEGLATVAEKLRLIIQDMVDPLGEVEHFTASIGATLMGRGERALEPAVARADRALYWSKDMGRNRVTLWRDLPVPAREAARALKDDITRAKPDVSLTGT